MTRDERQKQSLNAWTVQGYQGCLQAVTGFGKTRIAMMALRGLKKKGLVNKATVTVPTIVLKEQWERELESFGVADFTTVDEVLENKKQIENLFDLAFFRVAVNYCIL